MPERDAIPEDFVGKTIEHVPFGDAVSQRTSRIMEDSGWIEAAHDADGAPLIVRPERGLPGILYRITDAGRAGVAEVV